MMAGEIGELPSHRSVRLNDHIGAIDQGDIIEFGASDPHRPRILNKPDACKSRTVSGGSRRNSSVLEARSRKRGISAFARATTASYAPSASAPEDTLALGFRPAPAMASL